MNIYALDQVCAAQPHSDHATYLPRLAPACPARSIGSIPPMENSSCIHCRLAEQALADFRAGRAREMWGTSFARRLSYAAYLLPLKPSHSACGPALA
jgi:hypothetical protein